MAGIEDIDIEKSLADADTEILNYAHHLYNLLINHKLPASINEFSSQ